MKFLRSEITEIEVKIFTPRFVVISRNSRSFSHFLEFPVLFTFPGIPGSFHISQNSRSFSNFPEFQVFSVLFAFSDFPAVKHPDDTRCCTRKIRLEEAKESNVSSKTLLRRGTSNDFTHYRSMATQQVALLSDRHCFAL